MKQKVLLVLHTPPPVHGASMMGQYIKESILINDQFDTKYIRLGTTNTFKERKKTSFKKIFRFLKLIFSCFIISLSFRPAITYLSITSKGIGFYKDALIVIALKLTGSKLVYHFHNKGVSCRQDKFFDNWLYKVVFRKANVILLSKHLYYDVKKFVPENKVYYCPNGIPTIPNLNQKKNIASNNKTTELLFLSNLIESKGVFILLEACKILKGGNVPFHCTFIGGESEINRAQFSARVQELGLTENVCYAGRKFDKDKENFFRQADIFVFPTYYEHETFGLVNLEAMQFSLPVISTFEGGIPDVVEDGKTGFLVPSKNAQLLAGKIQKLIEDPVLCKKMGIAGKEKFLNEFTLEKFENRLANILEEVISHDQN